MGPSGSATHRVHSCINVDDGGTVTTVPLSGREQSNQAVLDMTFGSDHNIWLLTTGPMDGLIVRASHRWAAGHNVFGSSFPLVSTWWRPGWNLWLTFGGGSGRGVMKIATTVK